jgi:small-conductance mechanosensitive channel
MMTGFIEKILSLGIPTYLFFALFVSLVTGLLLRWVFLALIFKLFPKNEENLAHIWARRFKHVGYVLFPALCLAVFLSQPLAGEYTQALIPYRKGNTLLLIYSFCWLAIAGFYVLEDILLARYHIHKKDNFKERRLVTQIQYIRKIAIAIIVILAVGLTLMNFESVKKIGAGLLTSAGVAGIIIGFAAQKLLANLLAGIQIAFTQPIKIEDAVLVENEWGWIEEINLTYVVVKIWDLRRLVLPITYFVEKPFQNWTRTTANLLGSVFIYADYSLPVEALRKELKRILDNEPLWTGENWVLQVTNASPTTIELRALMSARNSPEAWDLRCAVREKMIAFIRTNYPESLPKTRVMMQEDPNYVPSAARQAPFSQ